MQPPDAATPDESLVTCGGPPSTPKVGYGQPPTATRFRKGQSGNPRGRPKGSKNVKTLLQQALNEKIMVNECGRRKKISKLQAGMKQLANKIAAGDAKTTLKIIEMYCDDAERDEEIRLSDRGPIASSLPATAPLHEKLRELTNRLRERIAIAKESESLG